VALTAGVMVIPAVLEVPVALLVALVVVQELLGRGMPVVALAETLVVLEAVKVEPVLTETVANDPEAQVRLLLFLEAL
jgi:hypothetical protein